MYEFLLGWFVGSIFVIGILIFWISKLNHYPKEVEKLQMVCAATYMMAGVINAPVRFLDVLSDAANGDLEKWDEDSIDELLPVGFEEFDSKMLYWELNRLSDKS